jgi:hypothetical protein
MQDEHQEEAIELRALQSSTTRVQDLAPKGYDETSSQAALLSSIVDLLEGHVDAAASNVSIGGGPIRADHRLVILHRAGAQVGLTWI